MMMIMMMMISHLLLPPRRMVDNLRVRGHPYNLPECSTNVHKIAYLLWCVLCMFYV